MVKLAKLMQLLYLLVALTQIRSFPGTIWLATAARRTADHTQWGQVMVKGTDGKLRDTEYGFQSSPDLVCSVLNYPFQFRIVQSSNDGCHVLDFAPILVGMYLLRWYEPFNRTWLQWHGLDSNTNNNTIGVSMHDMFRSYRTVKQQLEKQVRFQGGGGVFVGRTPPQSVPTPCCKLKDKLYFYWEVAHTQNFKHCWVKKGLVFKFPPRPYKNHMSFPVLRSMAKILCEAAF